MPEKQESEIDNLERTIATNAAQLIVESCCRNDPPVQEHWYSIEHDLEGDEKADVAMAVRYLKLRGLLQRDASNPNRVCLADELMRTEVEGAPQSLCSCKCESSVYEA